MRPDEEPSVLHGVLAKVATLPRHGSMLLYGPPAGGKSTLALSSFARPAVISTEMSPAAVVSYGHRLGVYVTKAAPPETLPAEDGSCWSWPYEPAEPDGLVLDSVNGAADPMAFLAWGIAEAQRRRLPLVAIAQVTVDGDVRGGTSLLHLVDVVVHVGPSNGQQLARCEKCRFGPPGTALFGLGTEGAQLAKSWWVVTGKAPAFNLEPWPWAASDVYAAADAGKLELPEAPIAVAAKLTRSMGWVEPPDAPARRAFAEASGVPYFTPRSS